MPGKATWEEIFYFNIGHRCECDKQANEDALIHGDRILSHYKLGGGRRIYTAAHQDL